MRIVKITGLLIFLAGFFLFNAATFLAVYRLTAEVIREKITDGKKQELFREYSRGIVDKTFSSSHSFVSALQETFDAINRAQHDRYKITEQEIDEIIRRSKGKFTTPTLDSVFRTSNEVAAFKNKALRQHVGIAEGEAFASEEEYKSRLMSAAETVEKYGTLSEVGFDKYLIKDLKYSLTKASAIGPVRNNPALYLFLSFGLCILGAMLYFLPKVEKQAGIKNDGVFFNPMKNRGWLGILTGSYLIGFYIMLYFYAGIMT